MGGRSGGTAVREGFAHEVVFYEGAEQQARALAPYVREGLAADEPVLAALLPDAIAALEAELGDDARRVTFLDMGDLGENPARIIPAWHGFLAENRRGGPVRGIGEPVWAGRREVELAEALLHESLLNLAFDGGPAWRLLCPYDVGALPEPVLAEARRSHPVVHEPAPPSPARYAGHAHAHSAFTTSLPEPPPAAMRIHFFEDDLTALRGIVRRVATVAGLAAEAVDDLVLATHELAMNSIQHGGGRGVLLTWQEPDALVVEIRDRGFINDPLIGRTMPDFGSMSGRGIWMANQLCSLVQVRSGVEGTQVRLHSWL